MLSRLKVFTGGILSVLLMLSVPSFTCAADQVAKATEKVSSTTKLLDTLNTYLQQAATVVKQHGPQVWEATLTLIRIQGLFDLALILLPIGILLFLLTKGRALVRGWANEFQAIYEEKRKRDAYYTDKYADGFVTVWVIWTVVTTIVSVTTTGIILGSFTVWLKVFSPELYLLYAVAHKAGIL